MSVGRLRPTLCHVWSAQRPVGWTDRGALARPTLSGPIPVRRWILAASLVLLNVADVVMTKAILARGGAEANPLVATFIDHPASPLLVKGLLALGIGVLLVMSPIERRFVDWAVGGVVGVYSVVVCWNITVLFQAIQATS